MIYKTEKEKSPGHRYIRTVLLRSSTSKFFPPHNSHSKTGKKGKKKEREREREREMLV